MSFLRCLDSLNNKINKYELTLSSLYGIEKENILCFLSSIKNNINGLNIYRKNEDEIILSFNSFIYPCFFSCLTNVLSYEEIDKIYIDYQVQYIIMQRNLKEYYAFIKGDYI